MWHYSTDFPIFHNYHILINYNHLNMKKSHTYYNITKKHSFGLCMLLNKHLYPNQINYNPNTFSKPLDLLNQNVYLYQPKNSLSRN